MIPKKDQIYLPPNAAELRKWILDDINLDMQDAGVEDPPTHEGTDIYIRATAFANAMLIALANIRIEASNANEQLARGTALATIRDNLGLSEIAASPATGQILPQIVGSGVVLFVDGLKFSLPSGLIGEVDGNQSIVNGQPLDVVMVDTGSKTNTAAGTQIKWVKPPVNVLQTGTVVSLTGGSDAETDQEIRARILQRRQSPPAGGNWSHCNEIAESATSSIQKAFCYPGLGGPGSTKVVLVKSLESTSYSRVVSQTVIDSAKAVLDEELPSPIELVVQSSVDEPIDVALVLTIPSAANGNGWANTYPFPDLNSGLDAYVQVLSVASSTEFTISATTSIEPTDASTEIAWWNPTTQTFTTGTITSHSGSSGSWTVSVDVPFTGIAAGHYISPVCLNLDNYATTWIEQMNQLGPGQNTTSPCRLANDRALRYPLTNTVYPSNLTNTQLTALSEEYNEIVDVDYSYRSKSAPTVPASVATAPNTLTPRNFGLYPSY